MISIDDIKKLANLARMKLTPDEEKKFAKEIDSIMGYVAQVQKLSKGVISENPNAPRNVLRDDETSHETGINTETILAEAPKREGQYIKVKKIM
jgi:aspartyl-tRNA(Asn)/glutamyl-tRNA(Gln) amidotransferase subunit C